MRRIKLALARMGGGDRKLSSADLSVKGVGIESMSTLTTTLTEASVSRRSIDDDSPGAAVLYDGSDTGSSEKGVDIIFIHHLGGSRLRSWEKDGICWPRDLLPRELPQSRIISWGYRTPAPSMARTASTYHQISNALCDSLVQDLSPIVAQGDRDIVFVAHGFGGIILKDALSTSAISQVYGKHSELANVYAKTVGIMFLGTAHKGCGKSSLSDIITKMCEIETKSPEGTFSEFIKYGEDVSDHQRDEFLLASRDIHVVCVREVLPSQAVAMVPKISASYTGMNVTTDDILGDHLGIARFSDRQDSGYFQLVGHISKLSKRSTIQNTEFGVNRNRQILDALQFDTREKLTAADEANREAAQRILTKPIPGEQVSEFQYWLESSEPIFWVSGSPGCGKSTAMKHAYYNPEVRWRLERWAGNRDLIMCAVFLHEGGTYLQKSRQGLLRGLLYQILTARPEYIPVCFPSFMTGTWPPPIPFNTTVNITQAFFSLFNKASQSLRLCFFIDGLDEYRMSDSEEALDDASFTSNSDYASTDEGKPVLGSAKFLRDSYNEISQLIMELSNQDHIKVCVSSREMPIFSENFTGVRRVRVHMQTEQIIAKYCSDRLDQESPGLSSGQRPLCEEIARKSGGDMLWARLAIDTLMEGSLKRLKSTLDTLPSQLGGSKGLYMRILRTLSTTQQKEACRVFRVVCRAYDPPNLAILAFSEMGYLATPKMQRDHPELGELLIAHDAAYPFSADDVSRISKRMDDRLKVSCAGLLECVDRDEHVSFMHLTTKEFILREATWDQIGVTPPSNVEIDLSLMSGVIRYLGTSSFKRSLIKTKPKFHFDPEAWLLVSHVLRYAARVDDEPFDRQTYFALLDHLDQLCSEALKLAVSEHVPDAEDNSWYKEKFRAMSASHWANLEPMEAGQSPRRHNFLALALQAGLFNYVSGKLDDMDKATRRAEAQDLLDYAVCPEADTGSENGASVSLCSAINGSYKDFHHDMPDSKFVHLLFSLGADATTENARHVWARSLRTGRTYFSPQTAAMLNLNLETKHILEQNRQRWVAAVKAMLHHGADPYLQPQAEALTDGMRGVGEKSSIDSKTALDMVRDTLDGQKEYARDVILIEALAVESMGKAK